MPVTFLIVTLVLRQLPFVLIQHRIFIQLVTIQVILLKSLIAAKRRGHAVTLPFTAHDLRDRNKKALTTPRLFYCILQPMQALLPANFPF
jgi:hypothetical protein